MSKRVLHIIITYGGNHLRSSLRELSAHTRHYQRTLEIKLLLSFSFSITVQFNDLLKMLLDDETLRRRRPGKLASCTVDFVYREFPFPTIQPTTSPRRRR